MLCEMLSPNFGTPTSTIVSEKKNFGFLYIYISILKKEGLNLIEHLEYISFHIRTNFQIFIFYSF